MLQKSILRPQKSTEAAFVWMCSKKHPFFKRNPMKDAEKVYSPTTFQCRKLDSRHPNTFSADHKILNPKK